MRRPLREPRHTSTWEAGSYAATCSWPRQRSEGFEICFGDDMA